MNIVSVDEASGPTTFGQLSMGELFQCGEVYQRLEYGGAGGVAVLLKTGDKIQFDTTTVVHRLPPGAVVAITVQ